MLVFFYLTPHFLFTQSLHKFRSLLAMILHAFAYISILNGFILASNEEMVQ